MKKGQYERRLNALAGRKEDLEHCTNDVERKRIEKEIEVLEQRINAERPIQSVDVEE